MRSWSDIRLGIMGPISNVTQPAPNRWRHPFVQLPYLDPPVRTQMLEQRQQSKQPAIFTIDGAKHRLNRSQIPVHPSYDNLYPIDSIWDNRI